MDHACGSVRRDFGSLEEANEAREAATVERMRTLQALKTELSVAPLAELNRACRLL